MSDRSPPNTYLSCFKCGRIVRSSDTECPRCGMKFGPGTLFECPFCAGLVWRSADVCTTCKTDLIKFSKEIGENFESFSMDNFVEEIIKTEITKTEEGTKRLACPSCGIMIRGDEETCPRCKINLKNVKVDCPVCGEKVNLSEEFCWNCGASFFELEVEAEKKRAKRKRDKKKADVVEDTDEDLAKIRAILATAKKDQEEVEEKKEKKKGLGLRKKKSKK